MIYIYIYTYIYIYIYIIYICIYIYIYIHIHNTYIHICISTSFGKKGMFQKIFSVTAHNNIIKTKNLMKALYPVILNGN